MQNNLNVYVLCQTVLEVNRNVNKKLQYTHKEESGFASFMISSRTCDIVWLGG